MGVAMVLALRLTVPLAIVRWPLGGALASIAADAVDILFFQAFGFPDAGYQRFDKLLDLYYLAVEAAVSLTWPSTARYTSIALFAYRLAGVGVFELTGARAALLVFPNLFELFYLLYLVVQRFRPEFALTPTRIAAALAVLLVPKLLQEYLLHYARVLDDLSALEIISDMVGAALRGLRRAIEWVSSDRS